MNIGCFWGGLQEQHPQGDQLQELRLLYDNFPVIEREESFVIDKTTLCLKTSHYKSWGIIAELSDCDFFGYEVGERLLYDANYGTIRVFIPLSCHETDCEKKNPKEHINKKEL